jgi:hypothetical protein
VSKLPERVPRLFSYVLRKDDGAAPNPFWGVCTLAICKPVIRRTAEVDDWVVGTGSKRAPDGRDLSGTVVYAMRITKKLSRSVPPLGRGGSGGMTLHPIACLAPPWADRPPRGPRFARRELALCSPVVVAEHPAEALATADLTPAPKGAPIEESVPESLMVPLPVVVLDVLLDRSAEVPLAEEDQLFEALLLDRPNEAFRMGVAVRRPAVRPHDADSRRPEDLQERGPEPAVVVADQGHASAKAAEDSIGQIARNIEHELVVGIAGDLGVHDPPRLEIHEEEHVAR